MMMMITNTPSSLHLTLWQYMPDDVQRSLVGAYGKAFIDLYLVILFILSSFCINVKMTLQ